MRRWRPASEAECAVQSYGETEVVDRAVLVIGGQPKERRRDRNVISYFGADPDRLAVPSPWNLDIKTQCDEHHRRNTGLAIMPGVRFREERLHTAAQIVEDPAATDGQVRKDRGVSIWRERTEYNGHIAPERVDLPLLK
jgi:hypothetical protein